MGAFLETPRVEKTTGDIEGNDLRAGFSAMQGWRIDMEDAHILKIGLDGHQTLSFFGVFDGHGGSLVSAESAEHLLDHITATEEFKSGPTDPAKLRDASIKGFLSLDAMLKSLPAVARGEDHSGSTAVTAFVTPEHIVVPNCGDSRAVLSRSGLAVALSDDHKPYNEGEQRRIEAAGGSVTIKRVNGDLAVSRSLGDFSYKANPTIPPEAQQVTALPEVRVEARNPADEFMIIACDGIWDVLDNQRAVDMVRRYIEEGVEKISDIGSAVLDECLELNSRDNMSIILVMFEGAPKPSPAAVEAYRRKKMAERAGSSGAAHS